MHNYVSKLIFLVFASSLLFTSCEEVTGCMDPDADNYNALARIGTPCIYGGCMDSTALNYDPNANENDYSCVYPPIGGCNHLRDDNYNEDADYFTDSLCNENATVSKFYGEWEFIIDEGGAPVQFLVFVGNHPDEYRIYLSSNFGLLNSTISLSCEVFQSNSHSYNYLFTLNGNGSGAVNIMNFHIEGNSAEIRYELEGFIGNIAGIYHANGVKVP